MGKSLFHIFADDTEILKIITEKYMNAKTNNQLDKRTEEIPLTSLCHDMEYHTALYYCIEKQNIKTFELIIKIISDFPGLCVTKMMVEYIPLMLTL